MARQKLINVHSGEKKEDNALTTAGLEYGEIAVQHTSEAPELIIKTGDNAYAHFADKETVSKEIKDSVTGVTTSLKTLTDGLGSYTTAEAITKVGTDAVDSAKTYTDGEINKIKGDSATTATLKSLQDAIDTIKGTGTTTGVTLEKLNEQVTKNTETIKGNTTAIGTNTDSINTINNTIGNDGDEAAAGGSIYARIKKNADDISALTNATSNLTDSVEKNAGNITNNTTNITALSGEVNTNKTQISSLKTTVGDHTTKLNTLEADIKTKIAGVYRVKGTKTTYEDLPTGATEGDVWNVTEAHGGTPAGTNYVWVAAVEGGEEAHWDALGGTIDLSGYYTKTEVDGAISAKTDSIDTRLGTAEETITAHGNNITAIQGWKINGSALSADFKLNGSNIMTEDGGQTTINSAIAEAKKAGTDASEAATNVKKELLGTTADTSTAKTIYGVSKGVEETKQTASAASTAASEAQARANKGITKIVAQPASASGVTFSAETTSASSDDVTTTITLDLSAMVINCGEY